MIDKEELKRMEERPGINADGTPIQLSKRKRVKRVAQKVVGGVASRTFGRVGSFVSKRLLGRVPETALEGSFQEEKPLEENKLVATPVKSEKVITPEMILSVEVSPEDQEFIEKEISEKIFSEYAASKAEGVSSDMKSDRELIEQLMTGKKEEQKSVA